MSEVQFNGLKGNYEFYKQGNSKANEEESEKSDSSIAKSESEFSADSILDALSIIGAQNFAQVTNKGSVDPADFLSQDRISSIEDSMADFEAGVEKYADVVRAEFGSSLTEEAIYSLAANAFALE